MLSKKFAGTFSLDFHKSQAIEQFSAIQLDHSIQKLIVLHECI